MANFVRAVTLGGTRRDLHDVETVADVAEELGLESDLTVMINGETATYASELSDDDCVSFGKKLKGAK